MKLLEIEKSLYRKHLNIVIVGFITCLLVLALAYGQLLIALFASVDTQEAGEMVNHSSPVAVTQEVVPTTNADAAPQTSEVQVPQSNFRFNLFGVMLSLLSCALVLHRLKATPFFHEVYYVWQVKQVQNAIYRKLKKIKAAAEQNEHNALIILHFYYSSLKQIYLLDDNTLTMSTLNSDIERLNARLQNQTSRLSAEQFEISLLAAYK